MRTNQRGDLVFRDDAGAEGVSHHRDRFGHADGVCQLHFATARQAGRHHVLGDITGHVARRAIHLGGILARESPAAVPSHAAVGVHDDLAPGEPRVAVRPADHEAPRGIDVIVRARIHHLRRNHRVDDVLPHFGPQRLDRNRVAVLRGNHHGVDTLGRAVDILHAHLALAIRTQEIQNARAPHLGKLPDQFVGQHDGQRHQFVGLVAGIAEHHALVAGAARIHAHGDVRRLRLDGVQHPAGIAVEAPQGIGVSDMLDGPPHYPRHIHVTSGGDLARHHADAGGHQHLASHAA